MPALKRALADRFHYMHMSVVQCRSVPVALRGSDILAKARTGAGKTLAFHVPALHRILSADPADGIAVLVLSPTRVSCCFSRPLAHPTKYTAARLLHPLHDRSQDTPSMQASKRANERWCTAPLSRRVRVRAPRRRTLTAFV